MPPAGAVRVDGVLDLSAIRQDGPGSRLERLPQVRVIVPAGAGEFGAALPVSHAQFIPGTCWAQVRLKVLRGRVELSALSGSKAFLADSSQLYRSSEPQDLALKISNLGEVAKIVVRNASGISFPNRAQLLEVEILDAAVFVDAKDWPQVKARMAAREQRCPALASAKDLLLLEQGNASGLLRYRALEVFQCAVRAAFIKPSQAVRDLAPRPSDLFFSTSGRACPAPTPRPRRGEACLALAPHAPRSRGRNHAVWVLGRWATAGRADPENAAAVVKCRPAFGVLLNRFRQSQT
jgi:hypothetical protein